MKAINIVLILLMLLITNCIWISKNGLDIATSKKIDFEKVQWFAERANAAYKSQGFIKEKFTQTVRVAEIKDIDVQYFLEVFPSKELQVLSIRGTSNLKNIKEDAEYWQSKNKKLKIYTHRGFDRDATKVYTDVHPYLNKEYKTSVTGHSLGAAIATLIMMYLHEDGFSLEPSINFGQPKVTNNKGVQAYNYLPITRVVDENDIVPLLPPITLLDSIHGIYEHLGEEVILLDKKYFVYLEKHDATRKSAGSFWKNISHESFKEHFMVNYLKNIESKISESVQVPYNQREQYIKKK